MSIFSYAVRNAGGAVVRGQTTGTDGNVIYTNSSVDVSLNLAPSQIASYTQSGNNLVIELINGEIITLDGYFSGPEASDRELFLSKDGQFHKVELGEAVDGTFIPNYDLADVSGKWSEYDELTFLDLERIEPVVAPLAAPALGWLGLAGAGAAATSLVAGGGDGGGNGDGSTEIVPTVDDPDLDRIIGGTGPSDVAITGTGEAGSTVTVTIGDSTQTTTVGDDGTWSTSFGASDLPADGDYTSSVSVVNPGGTSYDLTGPVVDIDTTPPVVVIAEGTLSVGEVVNAEEQADGHVISGTGEAGASVFIEIDGTTETTTVADDGTWSVNFASGAIATGDYETEITIVSTDARGNSTTVTDTLSVDTIAPDATLNTVAGDDVINADEASGTVTLTGTAEVGSTLQVQFQGTTHDVTVGSDGNWSLDLSAGSVAQGTYDSAITLIATDPAGNVNTQNYTVQVDTEGAVTLSTPIEGDDIANAAEVSDGITLNGTAEAGSEVVVTMQGVTRTVTAGSNGTWSADFAASEIPGGEYDAAIAVTATDLAGNVTTTSSSVRIDTQTDVSIDGTQVGDNIANEAEVAAGVSLTGNAEAGSQVQVTLQGVTKTVTAGSDGGWSANFAYAEIPQGEYDAAISVVSTDAAGNTSSATSTLRVDTELAVAIDAGQAGGDNIANAQEVTNSVTFTGTADAGSVVEVSFQGVTKTVTAASNGTWAATYASTEIPQGEYTGTLSVTATDDAGNTATSSTEVQVDTQTSTTISVQQASGFDSSVSAAELQNGLVLDGSAEAGAQIVVVVEGVTRTTTANESGYWSVTYEDGSLPEGDYTATATVTSTDIAGNTASSSHDFKVDTVVTDPLVSSVTFTGDDVSSLTLETESDTDYAIHALNANGSTDELGATEIALPVNESLFVLDQAAADGTHLVVAAEDDAGNLSDTLIVLDDNVGNAGTLDHAGLDQFQIQAIELDYASDTSLTLTEAQIKELSDTSDSLTIHGGSDDQVSISGASKTSETREIDGEDYDVYTVGDDGVTVIIDQDVNVVI